MVHGLWFIIDGYPTRRLLIICLLLFALLFYLSTANIFAQNFPSLSGVATNVEVVDRDAAAGDILSIAADGLKRTVVEYDSAMFGVVSASPVISVEPKTDTTRAVVSSGQAEVKVSAKNGAIAIGDFITSSTEAGVGQKATKPGFVLGKALAKYEDTGKSGTIPVAIGIGNNGGGSGGSGGEGGTGGFLNLKDTLANSRLVLATIAGIVAFFAAAFAFVKFMTTGLEAIGRNPLARKTILVGMILSGGVVLILSLGGVGIVAAIITLGKK